jgi:hypothetical protein
MILGLFRSPWRLPRPLAGLLCLVTVWCCASTAEATCGDYLSHTGQASSPLLPNQHDPAAPSTPCHGPNCQQAPDHLPLPAPQRVVILPTRDLLGETVCPNELPLDCQWLAVPSDILRDSLSGLRLFRPPRAIS